MKAACTIEGCTAQAVAKGLCAKHYMRTRRHGADAVARRGPKPGKGKAGMRAMLPPEWSPRTVERFRAAVRKMAEAGFTDDAKREAIAEATRPNGSINVSKLGRFIDFVLTGATEGRL